MAAPTTYTEYDLQAYLHAELGAVATALGWAVEDGSYDEAVNDALLWCGASDIADVTGAANIRKLRELGKLATWRRVAAHTAGKFTFSADGASYSREQVHAHAVAMASRLETECMAWLPEYAATTQRVDYLHDPYESRDDTERTL